MENLIPIIIWAAVIFLIIVRMKTGNKKAKKKTTTIESIVREAAGKGAGAATPKRAAEMAAKQLMSPARETPAAASNRKGTLSAAGIHDDRNDWLSQQLAEEKRSERLMSAMFGLKLEHALDCPAEKVRDEHAANCDAEKVRRYSRH